jgi:hypothetical protein
MEFADDSVEATPQLILRFCSISAFKSFHQPRKYFVSSEQTINYKAPVADIYRKNRKSARSELFSVFSWKQEIHGVLFY